MNTIKLFAVDIDGVLIEDTFSPVIRGLILNGGAEYTKNIERNMFSKSREGSSNFVKEKLGLDLDVEDMMKEFFKERNKYVENNKSGLIEGAVEFLEMLATFGIEIICYGGLDEDQIDKEFEPCKKFFSSYICTNDFRPGIKEILKMKNLKNNEVLFIDDVNTFAEEAKRLNVPFIGTPVNHSWGYQVEEMKDTGVKYIFNTVKEITKDTIKQLDIDAANNRCWN